MKRVVICMICASVLLLQAACGSSLSKIEETAKSSVESIGNAVSSIIREGKPWEFRMDGKNMSLGEFTMNDVKKIYSEFYEQNGLGMANAGDGLIYFYADPNGKIGSVVSESAAITAYKGVKVGMEKREAINALGTPTVNDDGAYDLTWGYTADGELITLEDFIASSMSNMKFMIGISFDGTKDTAKVKGVFITNSTEGLTN